LLVARIIFRELDSEGIRVLSSIKGVGAWKWSRCYDVKTGLDLILFLGCKQEHFMFFSRILLLPNTSMLCAAGSPSPRRRSACWMSAGASDAPRTVACAADRQAFFSSTPCRMRQKMKDGFANIDASRSCVQREFTVGEVAWVKATASQRIESF